jgi:uncharacterized protein with GYD domain
MRSRRLSRACIPFYQILNDHGGTLEAFYFAFGHSDFFLIMDLPDNVTAAAGSIMTNVTGTSKTTYTVLLTPEEIDKATDLVQEMTDAYRAPGR